jgi:hypothetical protein
MPHVPPISSKGDFAEKQPREALPTIQSWKLPVHSSHGIEHHTSAQDALNHTANADSKLSKVLNAKNNPILDMSIALGTNDPNAILQVPLAFTKKLQ